MRLRKDCVFKTHRRGLWKRTRQHTVESPLAGSEGGIPNQEASRPSLANSSSAPATSEAGETTNITVVRSGDHRHTYDAPRPPGNVLDVPRPPDAETPIPGTYPGATGSASLFGTVEQSPGKEEKAIRFELASFVTADDDAGELAVDVALDTQRRITEGSSSGKSLASSESREKPWQELDPINTKLLSCPAAEVLFEGYAAPVISISSSSRCLVLPSPTAYCV